MHTPGAADGEAGYSRTAADTNFYWSADNYRCLEAVPGVRLNKSQILWLRLEGAQSGVDLSGLLESSRPREPPLPTNPNGPRRKLRLIPLDESGAPSRVAPVIAQQPAVSHTRKRRCTKSPPTPPQTGVSMEARVRKRRCAKSPPTPQVAQASPATRVRMRRWTKSPPTPPAPASPKPARRPRHRRRHKSPPTPQAPGSPVAVRRPRHGKSTTSPHTPPALPRAPKHRKSTKSPPTPQTPPRAPKHRRSFKCPPTPPSRLEGRGRET